MSIANAAHCSMIGGGKKAPTAKDYVQSGLAVMWDGLENSGFDSHIAGATSWVDLSGNGNNLPIAASSVRDNGIRFSYTANATFDHKVFSGHAITLHAVIDRTETTGGFAIVCFKFGGSRLFVGNTAQYGARFSAVYEWLNVSGALNSITMTRQEDASTISIFNGTNLVGNIKNQISSIDTSFIAINGENAYGNYRNIFTAHNISIYNRVLTADEIAANYAIDKIRFGLP